jgi:sterol 3beta-glucosyltransferase
MAGIHIAEALKIPYFRAFTMPWTRTRAYPHAFGVPTHKQGGAYNYMSYVIIEGIFWKGTCGNVNRWRRNTLNLPATSLDKMQPNKVPFLYNFSPHVVPPPLDFSDWIRVTGYWFLDEGKDYKPPADLAAFIQKAKDDGKKLVYIGFGSILVEDTTAMTQTIFDSVIKADVRCILAKGWSDRTPNKLTGDKAKPDPTQFELPVPPEIFPVKSIPHDWLFPQCDAVAFHGGSGTTGAAMRAGVPIVAKPFFGDQFFFGQRIEDLGVGLCLKKLNSHVFGRALWEAAHSERIKAAAKAVGEKIRQVSFHICSICQMTNSINQMYRKTVSLWLSMPFIVTSNMHAHLSSMIMLMRQRISKSTGHLWKHRRWRPRRSSWPSRL